MQDSLEMTAFPSFPFVCDFSSCKEYHAIAVWFNSDTLIPSQNVSNLFGYFPFH
jgi:hypothetical protein